MKLPLDLNNPMLGGTTDQLAKLISTALLCTVMINFMPSIGTMDNKELLMNITALAILVITVIVNVCIELSTGVIAQLFLIDHVIVVSLMLILLIIMSFSALMVPSSKKVLQIKYRDMHKSIDSMHTGRSTVEKLKDDVNKYWMMAQTSSPQFVMACSETCSASGAICLLLATMYGPIPPLLSPLDHEVYQDSDYGRSTLLIFIIQTIGILVATVAPTFRCFNSLHFKFSMKSSKKYLNIFKIECYWTQKLVEWKEISPSVVQFGGRKCRKFVHSVKNLVLNFFIGFFIVIVGLSKAIRLIVIFFLILFLYCRDYYIRLKRILLMMKPSASSACNNGEALPSEPERNTELSQYVLQLQDGAELSRQTLSYIGNDVNPLIQTARKQQPKHLMLLLAKSKGFKGVVEFDSVQVPHLHSEEPPNCWSLPVIIITSIALALPNTKIDVADHLLRSVKEGLSYVKHVEKNLNTMEYLVNIRKAADVLWTEVEFYGKWLDTNLKDHKWKTSKEILVWLGDKAEAIVKEYVTSTGDSEENHVNWSAKVIAANSMYRICQTLLLYCQGSEDQTDEELLEKLTVMIEDILCACLTNLPRVITMKCYCGAIEEREESVRFATCLLGETEEILKSLQERELRSTDPDQVAYIEGWHN